jgi:hypothetical protein
MRFGPCLLVWVSISCLCEVLALAHAQTDYKPKPDMLFDEALVAMRAGDFDQACPKFELSYRLDPVPGALFTLAECEAAWGKTATALEHYRQFITMLTSLTSEEREKHDQRRQVAFEKMTVLHGLVPRITIVVPSDAPPDMTVERDGQFVDPMSYGVATVVDPGTHRVTAVSGQHRWEKRVLVRERDNARVDVQLPSVAAASAMDSPSRERPGWAYVAAGTSIAGFGVGAVTGILAVREKQTIDDECVDRLCTPEGKRAVNDGQRFATISTVGFGVGLIAGVGAVVLWPNSSSEQPPTPSPQPVAGPVFSAGPKSGWAGWAGVF